MKTLTIYDANDQQLYTSSTYLPTINPPDVDRVQKYNIFESVSGEKLIYGLLRPNKFDQRLPSTFTLSWEVAPLSLKNVLQKANANLATLKFRYDARWQQLECTVTGDRTVLINSGYYLKSGDMFWLLADYTLTVETNDTKIYITTDASTGLITVDSGTSVPEGATEIATITATTGNPVVITSSTTGVTNIRSGKIVELKTTAKEAALVSIEVTVVEVI